MKTFYGGTFMNKIKLEEVGINYPIKLEYYKIDGSFEENLNSGYGIEIVKTEYKNEKIETEKANIAGITYDEKQANEILNILKENQVTPIIAKDVIEDLTKYNQYQIY